ncbi:hypothetical protein B0H14DRAFT_2576039 [Mycena olivaceomarginata]|nr:hypothetical protein B0H14DRAFT_2576039 [Mycena olivaceomarginata]
MFFSASIALASVLSFTLTSMTVTGAPVTARARVVPQFCTGPNGTGTCTPLNANGSLIINADADCLAFTLQLTSSAHNCAGGIPREQFSDDSQDLAGSGIRSVNCDEFPGTVNGFTAGSAIDIAQEAQDTANGIAIPLR